MKFATKRV